MTNITKLNKTFQKDQILRSSELNSITGKIDDVISKIGEVITYINTFNDLEGDGGSETDSISESTIKSWIADAIAQLKTIIDESDEDLNDRIKTLEEADEGPTEEDDEEHWVKIFKKTFNITDPDTQTSQQIMNAIMQRMQVINEDGKPAWDVTALQEIQDDLQTVKTKVGSIEVLSDKISLIVKEENGEDVVDRAAIIASINNGQSTVGIEATNIILDGNTTLTQAIADKITVADLNAAKADIKQQVVGDLEAGNVTITGDLHYNRIIGNSKTVSTTTALTNSDYFVQINNSNSDNYIVVTLPSSDLVAGQTLFIDCGSKYFKLKSTTAPIKYFYAQPKMASGVSGGITGYEVWDTTASVGDEINAYDSGWNCVVQFIYTGSQWQQLIHNIRT